MKQSMVEARKAGHLRMWLIASAAVQSLSSQRRVLDLDWSVTAVCRVESCKLSAVEVEDAGCFSSVVISIQTNIHRINELTMKYN